MNGLLNDPAVWDGQYWDQAKLNAALQRQGKGADGRTIANNDSWMSALNPLSGLTLRDQGNDGMQYDPIDGTMKQGPAVGAVYQDKLGRTYREVGKDANGNAQVQFFDKSGDGFVSPTGNGRDRVSPTYSLDAQGNATPVSSGAYYNPSGWVASGRDAAIIGGTVASAGLLGYLGAGYGAAGGLATDATGATVASGAAGGGYGAAGATEASLAAAETAAAGTGGGGGAIAEGIGGEGVGGGVQGYQPALNAAQAESAAGTAGYGASSAGAGGGAGTLSTTGSLAAGATPYATAAAPTTWSGLSPAVQNTLVKAGVGAASSYAQGGSATQGAVSGAAGGVADSYSGDNGQLISGVNNGTLVGVAGGLLGAASSKGGGMGGLNSAVTSNENKIDPRMADLLYGSGGLLGAVNKTTKDQLATGGLNAVQQQGLQMQYNALMDPGYSQGLAQMRSTGSGLLGGPQAGNPFANGAASLQGTTAGQFRGNQFMPPQAQMPGAQPSAPMGQWQPMPTQLNQPGMPAPMQPGMSSVPRTQPNDAYPMAPADDPRMRIPKQVGGLLSPDAQQRAVVM